MPGLLKADHIHLVQSGCLDDSSDLLMQAGPLYGHRVGCRLCSTVLDHRHHHFVRLSEQNPESNIRQTIFKFVN